MLLAASAVSTSCAGFVGCCKTNVYSKGVLEKPEGPGLAEGLNNAITPEEGRRHLPRLNNGRAHGALGMPAELLHVAPETCRNMVSPASHSLLLEF